MEGMVGNKKNRLCFEKNSMKHLHKKGRTQKDIFSKDSLSFSWKQGTKNEGATFSQWEKFSGRKEPFLLFQKHKSNPKFLEGMNHFEEK